MATEIPVDLVIAGPRPEELFLARPQLVDVKGAGIPVIAAGDLIVIKVLAGRPKDLDDVRAILGQHRVDIDLDQVQHLLAELEAGLDRRDLLPLVDAALHEAG